MPTHPWWMRTTLTKRELQLLNLYWEFGDIPNKEMAKRLLISPTTIKTHRRAIYGILQVGDMLSAVKIALKRGWIDRAFIIENPAAPLPRTYL